MRKSLVTMAYVLCFSLVAGVMVLKVPSIAFGIEVTVDIHPETLNLKSNGRWITAYIELPEGYEVSGINISTVFLENVIPAESDPKYGFVKNPEIADRDNNGIPELMVKFDRWAVIDYIWVFKLYHMGFDPLSSLPKEGVEVELTITVSLNTETFEGSDTIRVIYKG